MEIHYHQQQSDLKIFIFLKLEKIKCTLKDSEVRMFYLNWKPIFHILKELPSSYLLYGHVYMYVYIYFLFISTFYLFTYNIIFIIYTYYLLLLMPCENVMT